MEQEPKSIDRFEKNKVSFSFHNQESIYVSEEGLLYYCNPIKDNALCVYDLTTKEENVLTDEVGVLCKTISGVYYIIENRVYALCDSK